MSEKKSKKASDIINEAKERFKIAADAEAEFRASFLEDVKFSMGDQWPDAIKKSRDSDNRPCLTINRIPQFIKQITNDQRQNKPSIKVGPVDDKGDVDTAKILQGLIRHVEYNSNADVAYDTAFDCAVRGGKGFFRVITDYCDPISFDQEILIKKVSNPLSVYLDPGSIESDGSDANWALVFDDLKKEDYLNLYPGSELSSMEDWRSLGDNSNSWLSTESVRVAEYFYKDFKEETILLLSDKTVVRKSDLKELPLGVTVKQERVTKIPVIKWCKLNLLEILEETEWPGQWIPIIPVYGEEINVDGKKTLCGVVKNAKDPQRMYNYWVSSETEAIALAPRAPWVGVEGQFEGHEAKWKTANTKNHAFLEYKPISIGGVPAPAPQRLAFEPAVQAITNARMQSADDLKATTGIYDASLGAKSNESSGIAIQRRNVQAQTANFHFIDNLSRSLRHLGRILVDIIPKIYDTERAVRIIGEDDEQKIVIINSLFEQKSYMLGQGKYDVTISNGPSYATKRQEAVASMIALSQSAPHITQFASDLMVKNMDWPGADEIAERLKKALPPGIAENESDDESKEVPPEVQAQMQQMNMMIEDLNHQLAQAQDVLRTKSMELESKERIELAKLESNIKMKMLEYDSKEAIELLRTEIDQINRQVESLNFAKEAEPYFQEESESHFINPTSGISLGQSME